MVLATTRQREQFKAKLVSKTEASSEHAPEEQQCPSQNAIIEQLRYVTDTLTSMHQTQSLLMEALLTLHKKVTNPPASQLDTKERHQSPHRFTNRNPESHGENPVLPPTVGTLLGGCDGP